MVSTSDNSGIDWTIPCGAFAAAHLHIADFDATRGNGCRDDRAKGRPLSAAAERAEYDVSASAPDRARFDRSVATAKD
jgi:hypothetical protein